MAPPAKNVITMKRVVSSRWLSSRYNTATSRTTGRNAIRALLRSSACMGGKS